MANIKEYKQSVFYGMNNSKDASELKYEAELIENFIISTKGKLIRRKGLTLQGTDSDSYKGLGLTHRIAGSTKTQIKVENTVIKALSGGVWSTLSGGTGLTAGLEMNFCATNDYIYGFNGTDYVKKINASSVTSVVGIPQGKFAIWWRNYMFVSGVASYPNRIYFSEIGNPESFPVDNYIDIEPGTGDVITGIIGGSERVTISKNYSFHYMNGSGTNTFAVYQIPVDFGCPSYRALVNVGTDVWCVDTEGRIRSVYRNQYGLLAGKDLSSDFLEQTQLTINKTALNKACAFFIDSKFGMAVATGSSTENDLVILHDLGSPVPDQYSKWTLIKGWKVACFDIMPSSTEDTLFIQSNEEVSDVYSWSGNTDNGEEIIAIWIGANVADDSPGLRKRNLYLKWFGFPLGDYNAQIYSSIDRGTFTNLGALNLKDLGGVWGTFVWGQGIWGQVGTIKQKIHYSSNNGKVVGNYRQLKLIYSANSDPCEIGNLVSYYKTLNFRL